MPDANLLIKKMPAELKKWVASQAEKNDRSMNKESIRLLEEARALRERTAKPARSDDAVALIVKRLQSLPVLDARAPDDILYDENGMPK